MGTFKQRFGIGLAAMGLLGWTLLTGCNNKQYGDEKAAVTTALANNGMESIRVTQNRKSGTMTLTGEVKSQAQFAQVTTVAKQAAPDYTVFNDVAVLPKVNQASTTTSAPSAMDTAIENNYHAALKRHRALKKQHISFTADNGKLVLKGSVRTERQKREAEELGKKVPNVQEVVNDIQVQRTESSTSHA